MKRTLKIAPLSLLLILVLALSASARLKNLNLPLTLDETGEQQFRVELEGLYCPIATDTTILQSGLTFNYGLSPYLVFSASLPWYRHIYADYFKMGQGDALLSLLLHHPQPFGLNLHLGWRSTLRLASGYREEFEGFPSYSADRIGFENLLIWEFKRHRLALDAWTGYFSDQAWENQRSIWGAAMRYDLWENHLQLFGEFGHEVNQTDKSTQRQLFAGIRSDIGFNVKLTAGIEQKSVDAKDYPGLFMTLQYTRQPRLASSVEVISLQPEMQQLLQEQREAVADTVAAEQPARSGGIQLALLPFSGICSPDVAAQLLSECHRSFGIDVSLNLALPEKVELALQEMNLCEEYPLQTVELQRLGQLLQVDYILTGYINECEHRQRPGGGIPWLFQTKRQQFSVGAELTLLACDDGRIVHHTVVQVQRNKPLSPLFFSSPQKYALPLSSPEAADLQRETISAWAQQALEKLFYTREIHWTTAD